MTVYRSIQHATTGKSPAELLFQRKIRGKLPDITAPHSDLEARDKDAEQKGKAKIYADHRRGAKTSDIEDGDQVLMRQDKTDKFTTTVHSTPHKVVRKEGNSVVVQSPTGVKYARNTTSVKKFLSAETPIVDGDMICAQEPSYDKKEKRSSDECREISETFQGEEQIPKPCRPQRLTKLPERFRDYVVE